MRQDVIKEALYQSAMVQSIANELSVEISEVVKTITSVDKWPLNYRIAIARNSTVLKWTEPVEDTSYRVEDYDVRYLALSDNALISRADISDEILSRKKYVTIIRSQKVFTQVPLTREAVSYYKRTLDYFCKLPKLETAYVWTQLRDKKQTYIPDDIPYLLMDNVYVPKYISNTVVVFEHNGILVGENMLNALDNLVELYSIREGFHCNLYKGVDDV